MSLVSSLNVHGVKRVTIEAEREYKGAMESYVSRILVIETDQGSVEITLFSRHKDLDEDGPYMEFIV